jgi:ribosomal protein S1
MQKWTLPNVIPSPPCRSEKIGRDESLCGVNLKDPNRIEFPEFGNEGADVNVGDVDEVAVDMIEKSDDVPCANRFPTDGAN